MNSINKQATQRVLAFKASRAKEIATKVKAWSNGDLAMDSQAAMQQIELLCSYTTEINDLVALLQQGEDNQELSHDEDPKPTIEDKKRVNYGDRISRINALSKGVDLPSHRLTEFRQIADLMLAVGWELKKGKMRSDIKQWVITAKDGSKGGLYLGSGTGWSLDSLKPNEELKGDLECIYLEEWLSDNGVEIE